MRKLKVRFISLVSICLTFLIAGYNKTISETRDPYFSSINNSMYDEGGSLCNFITIDDMARMGNKMFQYASLYGIAKTTKKKPFLKKATYLLNNFFKLSIVHQNYSLETFVMNKESGCCKFKKNSTLLPCDVNVTLRGFRQSYKYFDKYKKEIKAEYTFHTNISKQCDKILVDAFQQMNESRSCFVVGVHMRRGDFVRFTEKGYVPADQNYLRTAIRYFETRFRKQYDCLQFLIVGDNVTWNLENAPKALNIFVFSKNSAEIDMCILSKCNGTIMSTGSFGWWGAYLADGPTTYMKNQCSPNSRLCKRFVMSDYINPDWDWIPL